ncbi:alpha/beta hydrolase-like protein [Rhodococcus opacus M213]|uniref:Alpha/beta hydrolase-like protein n=1 Tax=Rhodococcus opacus M213 TaxID=1129896 RepID=K8XL59_RHOOP|nr:alpha/beta fold hydrolase [Rhodococcus opacus]EKT82139.1 alpha/beta hydrolase-like protein [Rhodococcus opacus M213]
MRTAGKRRTDLAALLEHLDLHDTTLVGLSSGGGEVSRYVERHGTGRVAQIVLASAVPPFMLQTADNPDGIPVKPSILRRNRPDSHPSQGVRDSFWSQANQGVTTSQTKASPRSRRRTSELTSTRSTSPPSSFT